MRILLTRDDRLVIKRLGMHCIFYRTGLCKLRRGLQPLGSRSGRVLIDKKNSQAVPSGLKGESRRIGVHSADRPIRPDVLLHTCTVQLKSSQRRRGRPPGGASAGAPAIRAYSHTHAGFRPARSVFGGGP